jgi:hypothetical protein
MCGQGSSGTGEGPILWSCEPDNKPLVQQEVVNFMAS